MAIREHREEGDHLWLTMEANSELFQKEYETHFKKVVSSVSLAGFRKGHAPTDMVIAYLKKRGTFQRELEFVVNKIIEKSVVKLSEEDKEWDAKIFGYPIENTVTEFDLDKWYLKFESKFEKFPVVELADYSKIETLIEHKEPNLELCPVPEDKEAEKNDVVAIAMHGKDSEGNPVNKYCYEVLEIDLENTKLKKEIVKEIIGSKAKDKKELTIKVKDKEVKLEIWIIEVRRKVKVDQELVDKLKIPLASTVEQLQELITKQHKIHNSFVRYQDLLKWLYSIDNKVTPFPVVNVRREASKHYSQLMKMGRKDISFETLLFDQTKNLKTTLVLDAIAKKEKFEVDDKDKEDFAKDIEENPWIYGNRRAEDIFNCEEAVLKEYILQFKTIRFLKEKWTFSS